MKFVVGKDTSDKSCDNLTSHLSWPPWQTSNFHKGARCVRELRSLSCIVTRRRGSGDEGDGGRKEEGERITSRHIQFNCESGEVLSPHAVLNSPAPHDESVCDRMVDHDLHVVTIVDLCRGILVVR
jgi:hypothetical protein